MADRERLRFYVDESALGLGKALTAARSDTVHVGHPLVPECPYGAPDPAWMPAVAARGLIAIGRWLTWMVRRWDDIEEIVDIRGPGPWWYVTTERSVRELPLV